MHLSILGHTSNKNGFPLQNVCWPAPIGPRQVRCISLQLFTKGVIFWCSKYLGKAVQCAIHIAQHTLKLFSSSLYFVTQGMILKRSRKRTNRLCMKFLVNIHFEYLVLEQAVGYLTSKFHSKAFSRTYTSRQTCTRYGMNAFPSNV